MFGSKKKPTQVQHRPAFALPEPSEHGTYWFDAPPTGPAIFKAGVTPALERLRGKQEGKFFASLGSRGILMDGLGIRYFDSPEEALAVLSEELGL